MARPRQDAFPWTLKVLEILEDGEWHNYKDILSIAAPLVPPAVAWRKAEANRETHYRRAGREVKDRQKGERNDTIKTGQRTYVNTAIRGLARRTRDRGDPRVEVEYNDSPQRPRPLRVRLYKPKTWEVNE